jgi:crotonobetainyl-CoA:carnitine CoA-transferase CaiB-like acyl-CoA transferase
MNVLDGIRVVDLSQVRTGAQATQVLADFGAEVLWIEPPGGSPLRAQRGFPLYGRGKQSVVLDLKTPTGRAAAADLAAGADVFVESFRPGVAERLGLGYATLAERAPGLVYASITGFGRQGPFTQIKAYEGVVQAKMGVFKAFERMAPTSHPPFVSAPWCSFGATQTALHGILTALIERERSGSGQWVEASMVQGFAALDTWDWFVDLITQRYPDAFTSANPFEDAVPMSPVVYMLLVGITSDGHWLQFAQVAPHLFLALMKALGLTWMFTDPQWQGIPLFDDPQRRSELLYRMQAAVAEKSLAEWQAIFEADPNVFAEVCRSGPAVLQHPQLVACGEVIEVAAGGSGPVRQPGALTHVIGAEADVRRPPPAPDEHEPALARQALPAREPCGSPPVAAGSDLPLAGVTIVEMAVQFAAPYGTTVLTDLGARVIKIEPLAGDIIRTMMPFPEVGGAKVMQGKDSICVDITTKEGADIVRKCAGRADLILDGFRPGAAERHGLGPESLRKVNPNLVYVSASGYGEGGPYSNRPAFAPSIGAAGGITRANLGDAVQETSGLSPRQVLEASMQLFAGSSILQAQADGFAALGVGTSLLLGLLARARTGEGQRVSSSMLATVAHAMAEHVVDGPGLPQAIGPGEDMRGPHALYRIYDAADGWVFLAVTSDAEWLALADALRDEVDLAADARFATAALRAANDKALAETLAELFSGAPKGRWEERLLAADVACVAVSTERVERFLQGEQTGKASGYVVEVTHPTFEQHLRLAPLVRFSRSATQAKPGVLAGQATDAILTELGYDSGAIADLRARKIVA